VPIRCLLLEVSPAWSGADPIAVLRHTIGDPDLQFGLVAECEEDLAASVRGEGVFVLAASSMGVGVGEARLLAAGAALAGCMVRDVVVVASPASALHLSCEAVGARSIASDGDFPTLLACIVDGLRAVHAEEAVAAGSVGVGPHPGPWPGDAHLDPNLLAHGDRRNVVDRYRYWTEAAIIEDLDRCRLPVHVAVENWQHDLNIGTVVRNANAFNVAGVHIVGKRRWNRRGAMATDRYLRVHHHESVDALAAWAAAESLPLVGIDNIAGAISLEDGPMPDPAVLVFGQEGPGLSEAMASHCDSVRAITQYGSTRSLNAGVASGIALHTWTVHHLAWLRDGPGP